jgi:uncharacterized membrane protein
LAREVTHAIREDTALAVTCSAPATPVVHEGEPVLITTGRDHLAEHIGWMLASLTVVYWGLRLWTGSALYQPISALACVLLLAGLASCVASWTLKGRAARIHRTCLIGLWIVGFMGYGLLYITWQPGYGTDEIAFNQRAAELLLKGLNPYTASLANSLDAFMVPEQYHTWLLNGHEVARLSYPALSFLVYLPALALGTGFQTAFVVNVVAWITTVVLLYFMLPWRLRWAAPLLGTLTNYVDFTVGGVTDMVFLPFLLIAVWRWDRYGDPTERSVARWIGPFALGMAMSVKQTPWFVLPLLLIGIALEARARAPGGWWRLPVRYGAIAAGTFGLINLPFIIWNPGAFMHGILVPLIEQTVPAGQGVISLALFQHMGGQLEAFKLAGIAAMALLIGVWTVGYRQLKPVLLPLVAIVFFWSTRSFASYLIDLLPAALIAGTSVRTAPVTATLGSWQTTMRILVGALGVALAGCVAVALASPQPLKLYIVGIRSTGQLQSVREITAKVTNTTNQDVTPVFSVISGAYLSRAWIPQGTATVRAKRTALITLIAPNQQAMPSLEGGWVLIAFSRHPDAMSTSRIMPSSNDRLSLLPSTVNRPVPIGQTVNLDVQLRNQLGYPQAKAGVPVLMGQVVYGQDGILAGEAQINDHATGRTPVGTVTDTQGVAHFQIRGEAAQDAPVFFQAWIGSETQPPHAYSQQLSIQFVSPPTVGVK